MFYYLKSNISTFLNHLYLRICKKISLIPNFCTQKHTETQNHTHTHTQHRPDWWIHVACVCNYTLVGFHRLWMRRHSDFLLHGHWQQAGFTPFSQKERHLVVRVWSAAADPATADGVNFNFILMCFWSKFICTWRFQLDINYCVCMCACLCPSLFSFFSSKASCFRSLSSLSLPLNLSRSLSLTLCLFLSISLSSSLSLEGFNATGASEAQERSLGKEKQRAVRLQPSVPPSPRPPTTPLPSTHTP